VISIILVIIIIIYTTNNIFCTGTPEYLSPEMIIHRQSGTSLSYKSNNHIYDSIYSSIYHIYLSYLTIYHNYQSCLSIYPYISIHIYQLIISIHLSSLLTTGCGYSKDVDWWALGKSTSQLSSSLLDVYMGSMHL